MLNHQGRLAVVGSTAMTQSSVGSSCYSVVFKLTTGDGIKSIAEIEYQQVFFLSCFRRRDRYSTLSSNCVSHE